VLTTLKTAVNGPKVDIRKDIVAHLGNRVTVLTSHVKPVGDDSERVIAAIELTKPAAVQLAIDKALQGDPDARKRQVDGHDYWEILSDKKRDAIDGPRIKAPFGPGRRPRPAQAPKNQQPLPNSAVTVMHGHLMLSSGVDALVALKTAAAKDGKLAPAADYNRVTAELAKLGSKGAAAHSFARAQQSLEAPYELMKTNNMPKSKSLFGRLLNRLLVAEDEEGVRKAQVDGKLLPPYAAVEKYLGPAGSFLQNDPNGWLVTGCVLPQNAAEAKPAPAEAKPADAEDTKPTDTKPADPKPEAAKPEEAAPAEASPEE